MTGARETAGSSRLDGAGLVDLMCAPSEVVVVGASADESKLSSRALAFLLRYGYRGGLHVVHPRHESILGGCRACPGSRRCPGSNAPSRSSTSPRTWSPRPSRTSTRPARAPRS
ncbi:CoA-binding protein [Nonomuraea ferruginea]